MAGQTVAATASGRINLIGEHTDYTGGLALPMAIDRGTTVRVTRGGDAVRLVSDHDPRPAVVPLEVDDPAGVDPPWARYVAGVVAELKPDRGAVGTVTSNLPIGAGVSSSASLEVAVALGRGFEGSPRELAQLCQRAEHRASGVPCGIMDQLAITCGQAGSALLLDCHDLSARPLPIPAGWVVLGVHSGVTRQLASSAYARRRAECAEGEAAVGPLRECSLSEVETLRDPVIRRRARHVVTENERVRAFARALGGEDAALCGRLLDDSHRSLRDDFEVSTPVVDDLVDRLRAVPGVHGARMTGAGFGGMVIALCDADTELPAQLSGSEYRPSAGVSVSGG